MKKLSHTSLTAISGMVWIAVGLYLLPLGVYLLILSSGGEGAPIITAFSPYTGAEAAALSLLIFGFGLGYMKARYVFAKAVQRNVLRIRTLPNPASITQIYGARSLILLAVMAGLGMAMRRFGVPPDIRGMVDVAVGSGLINGGLAFFKLKEKTLPS